MNSPPDYDDKNYQLQSTLSQQRNHEHAASQQDHAIHTERSPSTSVPPSTSTTSSAIDLEHPYNNNAQPSQPITNEIHSGRFIKLRQNINQLMALSGGSYTLKSFTK